MTSKEKALELVNNFYENGVQESFNFLEYYPEDLRDYWRKVKQEIIKL